MTGTNVWFLLDSGRGHYDFNMALDEALLEAITKLGRPVLRFYGWLEPAASFGYFQKYAEVERLTNLRPLVRRPTGGGLVPHDCDWTYSLVFPTTHEWHSQRAVETYKKVHHWIQRAFTELEVPTQLASAPLKSQAGQCFVGFEQFDLLCGGQKIAGAAQRRRKDGLLIQGSVQPPSGSCSRTDWERAMVRSGETQQGLHWDTWSPGEELVRRAEELAGKKYSQASYNQRR